MAGKRPGRAPELAVSLPLGAGRLTRLFLPDDPPSRAMSGSSNTAPRYPRIPRLRALAGLLTWDAGSRHAWSR